MFTYHLSEYDLHRIRHAELIATAKHEQLIKQVLNEGTPVRTPIRQQLGQWLSVFTLRQAARRIFAPSARV
jgi:hypothetical protein